MREPGISTNASQRLKSAIGFATAVFVLGLGTFIGRQHKDSFVDFNLHYFGGLVQRHGITYTDTAAIFTAMDEAGVRHAQEGVYGTPALIALVFEPLSLLSLQHAHMLWDVVCIVLTCLALYKAVKNDAFPFWVTLVATTPVMLFSQIFGNPCQLTFALLVYSYAALRDNQSSRSGVALGLAIALKLYPAFIVIALVAHRKWEPLKWACITVLAAWTLTLAVIGPADMAPALEVLRWVGGWVHEGPDNVSAPGLIAHFTQNQTLAHWVNRVLLVAGAVAVWRFRSSRVDRSYVTATLVMLTVQSIAWRMYLPLLVLAPLAMRDAAISIRTKRLIWMTFLTATGGLFWFLPQSLGHVVVLSQGISTAALAIAWLVLMRSDNLPIEDARSKNLANAGNQLGVH